MENKELLKLIEECESMNDEEKGFWKGILPILSIDKIFILEHILKTEKIKLKELDEELNSLYKNKLKKLDEELNSLFNSSFLTPTGVDTNNTNSDDLHIHQIK